MYVGVTILSVFYLCCLVFFFQAEDGIRDLVRSRGLGDVYKRQALNRLQEMTTVPTEVESVREA